MLLILWDSRILCSWILLRGGWKGAEKRHPREDDKAAAKLLSAIWIHRVLLRWVAHPSEGFGMLPRFNARIA